MGMAAAGDTFVAAAADVVVAEAVDVVVAAAVDVVGLVVGIQGVLRQPEKVGEVPLEIELTKEQEGTGCLRNYRKSIL